MYRTFRRRLYLEALFLFTLAFAVGVRAFGFEVEKVVPTLVAKDTTFIEKKLKAHERMTEMLLDAISFAVKRGASEEEVVEVLLLSAICKSPFRLVEVNSLATIFRELAEDATGEVLAERIHRLKLILVAVPPHLRWRFIEKLSLTLPLLSSQEKTSFLRLLEERKDAIKRFLIIRRRHIRPWGQGFPGGQ